MALAKSLMFDAAIVGPSVAIAAMKSRCESYASGIAIGGGVALGALLISKFVRGSISGSFPSFFSSSTIHTSASASSSTSTSGIPGPEQVFNLIKKRRSVFPRDYNGQPVSRDIINKLLEAGNWAPSNGLSQPYRFVVFEGEERYKLQDIMVELLRSKSPPEEAEQRVKRFERKRVHWPKVPTMIALCCKLDYSDDESLSKKKRNPEWEEFCSVGACTQNMMLLATSYGIASYWASFPDIVREADEFKQFLGISTKDRCLGFLILGQSDVIDSYRGARKDVADKTVFRE
uniref:Nitroreductase domain-containing protein n=1 Tax=Polytomella parva TaxID=51329 RepID=A0A7S0UZA5_9CHLO|mmetsp:Transcript_19331/g.34907  ORF Transcript_19331/g.34907 Transcript_19331/m.34907 type:complete len:289 (+) Transcript_19331:112-978(+)|eukprot:CAMPEP_0175052450 /NCGR_PEP_ID=MMETSP0052_2-20121109/8368_1 /TAXON_ID=51329 ORGANISM="Polytomella parva, Strain SAG 63-3" /NCGR_SAMPLE_ID=MMETSP0052_2 /ASSEMBLY_ACC=CAM_ASM_000194 /LENGTH=288 /DNA_ID=CAMNT_0016316859 /DNA_START=33 /DNA_END=899 /DNA_ORIENTATION=-